MRRGSPALVLLIAGLALAFLGFAADAIGLGTSPGMGYLQIVSLVLGIALVVAALLMRRR
jgi:hypothetical protein